MDKIREQFDSMGQELVFAISQLSQGVCGPRLADQGAHSTLANDVVLERWAAMILSALADQRYCLLYHPLCRHFDQQTWPNFRHEYVSLRWKHRLLSLISLQCA